jgi:chromosomal replication initiation ATPase DnaA
MSAREPVAIIDGMRDASRLIAAVQGDGDSSQIVQTLTRLDLEMVALHLAERLVASQPSGQQAKIRTVREVGRVVGAVSSLTGISVPQIYGRDRTKPVAAARHIVCYVAFALNITVVEIGLAVGRDHGTVSASIKRVRHDKILREIAHQTMTHLSGSTP